MEQLQLSYIRAIAAAAGCVVTQPEIDDGIDIELRQRHSAHVNFTDNTARLEIQLKSTASQANISEKEISTKMRRDRFDYYAAPAPLSVHKIVVIMKQPVDPAHWTYVRKKGLTLHHACYWVNLSGETSSASGYVAVNAPLTQVFDDIALCAMMERIGKGEAP
ncbi:DUF4365 domain-containing protein [Winogradskya humida]|uniref:DUF4365 domain-containing protein n=1 Tax=Winogradskya humida TaxID=113566 RepID=A0ABQ4A4V8_9ACTN|nr:DUF4365 domain-containing protein [Actinoplanes humidus]GIE25891.1 hypothetical protein Ahu01nite_089930 [Actinoplanes humidus]